MKENPSKHKNKKSGTRTLIAVQDIVTTCPKCGGEVGLWSEEPETICVFCEHQVFERENTVH
jgi:hypothetical protein